MTTFEPMGASALTDAERHPLLTATGRRVLTDLLEAGDSPRWNHRCGDRLDRDALATVRAYADLITTEPPQWTPDRLPAWVAGFVERAVSSVPHHRASSPIGPTATSSRDDLERAWWSMVPDDVDLEELIWLPTSGTGRAPVVVPTHPIAVSSYYPLLLEAARWHGVTVRFREDRADWITVASQTRGGFTVPSWSSLLGCATAKVNLEPVAWRAATDRARFLERHDPQVITGDPVSLSALADLDLGLHPAVVFTAAIHLTPATRARLESHFTCPVVDLYSTTETGPIAATQPGGGLAVLQPRLYVEIVDDLGIACDPGQVGTVTVTGGMNPYLPLVRYRVGDTARMSWTGGRPSLTDLIGRPMVTLRSGSGSLVPSLDVTLALQDLALRRWSVRQHTDDAVTVSIEPERGASDGLPDQVEAAVHAVLGSLPVTVVALAAADKVVPFTVEGAT